MDVSALTKQGVDKLIEMILLQADLLELKANPNRRAKGNVIESGLEPGGPTATVLVRKGTLRVGDVIICGQYYGRVRALINEEGKRLKEAAPSVAVKVLGLNGVPEAGLEFSVVEDEKAARDLAEQRGQEAKALGQEATRAKVTLENLFDQLASTTTKVLKVVVKADTQGSVEAIVDALKKIESEKVSLEVIHSAVGTITESDVALASASDAVILGFHTRIDSGVADKAKHEGVQIKLYAIIYELIDQVKEAMAGLLEPLLKDITVGAAEVRKIFALSKGAPVAGCMVRQRPHRQRQGPRAPPQGDHLRRHRPVAPPLSGRSQRGARRHGMRHSHRGLQRVPDRRQYRVLHDGEDRAEAVTIEGYMGCMVTWLHGFCTSRATSVPPGNSVQLV